MAVVFHHHALERMKERGVTADEVTAAIAGGEEFPAKFQRAGFRRNFAYNEMWRNKFYGIKQVEVYAVPDGDDWIVITVIARYF
ncbi:MAG: DUF4258 domain-containing protein [Nitrospirae bacterium]|nr:DUF4258 domain-containing protein [Nitrospirota bacterium]